MKRAVSILIIAVLALCLFGCNNGGNDAASSKSGATEDSATQPATQIHYSDKTQEIGNEGLGYMSVPDNFTQLPQAEGKYDLQYADPSGTVVFTLNKLSSEVSSLNAMLSIEETVKKNGATEVETDMDTSVNNMKALRLDCYYPGEKKSVTIFLVPSLESTNYIAAEYPKGDKTALEYLQSWHNTQKTTKQTSKIKKTLAF